tara:strand:- start:462 stop:644 length:183 start_codon:yes stop_codon:yes gene_type:complete
MKFNFYTLLNIISLGLISFGIYSWFNDFNNWGGTFGGWILFIALILFIISVLQNPYGRRN